MSKSLSIKNLKNSITESLLKKHEALKIKEETLFSFENIKYDWT